MKNYYCISFLKTLFLIQKYGSNGKNTINKRIAYYNAQLQCLNFLKNEQEWTVEFNYHMNRVCCHLNKKRKRNYLSGEF